jgi:hypothetical protein
MAWFTRHPPRERKRRPAMAATAPFGTVVALALLAAGGVLSVFSAELKRVGPLSGIDPQKHALWLSVAAVVTAGFLFICRQKAVDRERADSQEKMMGLADELREAVLTMPPRNFIEDFARYYEEAERLVRRVAVEADAKRQAEMIPPTIRSLLRIICHLAGRFDDAPPRAEYSANVMVYRATDGLSLDEQERLGACLRLSADDVGLNALRGVLELRGDLSVSGDPESADPNPDLPNGLALPLYRGGPYAESLRPGEDEYRYRILPGAPVAFEHRTYALVERTSDVRTWCERHTILDSDDVNRVVEFFQMEEGSLFRSFLSIAIPDVRDTAAELGAGPASGTTRAAAREIIPVIDAAGNLLLEEDRSPVDPPALPVLPQPVAVVNVECTLEGMLRGSGDRLDQFVNAITPFKLMLARLLAQVPTPAPEVESPGVGTA